MIKIDEFTNFKDLAGRAFHDLDYNVRVLLHQSFSQAELVAIKTNNVTPSLLEKGQSIINQHFADMNPTMEQVFERRMNQWNDQKINEIERSLKRKIDVLKKLDEMADNDEKLPVGRRKEIRDQIQADNDLLKKLGKEDEKTVTKVSDEVLKTAEDLGFAVEDFTTDNDTDNAIKPTD